MAPPAQDAAGSKLKAASARTASSPTVRAVLIGGVTVFATAAAINVLRYLLLLINRTVLLPQWVALPALVFGILASLAAIAAVGAVTVVMTAWLIERRAAAYRRFGQEDPRPAWTLWAGCLIPVASLFWAPVFLIELAHAQGSDSRLRRPITKWWVAWAFSTLMAVWATWTRRGTDPQAIADNTVTMIVAYLAGAGAIALLLRVFDGFVGTSAHRPRQRWVVVTEAPVSQAPVPQGTASQETASQETASQETSMSAAGVVEHSAGDAEVVRPDEAGDDDTESGRVVESQDREPAA